MNIPVHIYECEECVLVFAVEMAFEDQSIICCPSCGNEDLNDVAAGSMTLEITDEEIDKALSNLPIKEKK